MKTQLVTTVLSLVALFSWHSSVAQDHARPSNGLTIAAAQQAPDKEQTALQMASTNMAEQGQSGTAFSLPDKFDGKEELLDKRDMNSKHFANTDGSLTAIVATGPIHYNDNGTWQNINHGITATTDAVFTYANTTNLFESYFGATSAHGVKNKTAEGEVKEFLNKKMYWEVGGQPQTVTHAASVPVSVNGNKASYNNLFGSINAEFTIASGKRKLNYVIPNAQALSTAPAGANYLVFTEDVELPQDWTYAVDNIQGIVLKDASGNTTYAYQKPVSIDASGDLEREVNTIMEASLSGNTLTILTKVKTDWLLDGSRTFPVKVDPTVTLNSALTSCVYDDGGPQNGSYMGRVSGYWLRNFNSFNIAAIPAGSTVNSASASINITNNSGYNSLNSWRVRNALDPETNAGFLLYSSANTNLSANAANIASYGVKTVALNAAGFTYLENAFGAAEVHVCIDPAGSYANTNYYTIQDITLTIDYTPAGGPPSCATLLAPANGATGHAANTAPTVVWDAVGGATGYDVYFGTSATPPLVSTNQAGTSYTVSGCLPPSTTYYWKVVPKNNDGDATGCPTWSFTTDTKLLVYETDWEEANEGYFGTSGLSVDGWYTNSIAANGFGETNTWTLSTGTLGINGKSAGVSALLNYGYAGLPFQYYMNLGIIHRWIYRPMDLTGLRDVEVSFNWRCGGEVGYDYGEVASSINGGSTWLTDDQGGLNDDGEYSGSANTVRAESIVLPASRNNESNFVLAFKWNNDDAYSEADPTFVVDDIFVKACPYEGVISSTATAAGVFEWNPTGSTETTLAINGSHSCAQYEWEQSTDAGSSWVAAVGGSGAATVSYTTPNNISVSTWYRCRVYYGTGCPGAYQDEPFKIGPPVVLACAEVANPTLALGNPANGTNHHLALAWDALSGATEYHIEVSTTGTFTGTPTATVATNSYDFDAADNPNVQYYFQVRASDGSTDCDWTDFGSLYTAADNPVLPTVNNATGATLDVTLVNETPVNNSAITTYSIKEDNSGLFVQANGSLGATEVFQTKATWGTQTVTGLASNTEYCFIATAQNGNGDTRGGAGGATVQTTQPFNASGSLATGANNTAAFYSPASCTTGGLAWNASQGCSGGAVGFSGNWNNYFGCYLRTPAQNCTGLSSVTMTFDISNSYFASQPNDKVYFNMWAPTAGSPGGTYIDATTVNGTPTDELLFSSVRNCESVTVEFDLSTVTDKSAILFYINANCGYNNSNVFYVWLDNVTVEETAPTACATTTACTPGTWTGITSTNWSNTGNWSCGVLPTPTSDVVIPTNPTGSFFPIIDVASVTVNDLTLETGATLNIPTARSFTTTADVVNNGTVTVENGGNFIQTMASTTHTGTGNFIVKRQGNSSGGFNGWSSPVVGGNLPGSNGYWYNASLGTNSSTDDNNPNPDPGWVAHSGAMLAGRGYFSTNGGSATFTGKANNGNYSPSVTTSGQPLSSTIAPSVFNLIGNPYPSSLDADQFITDNSATIDGALYYWADENAGTAAFSSDDYATYSIGGSVVPLTAGGSGGVPVGSIPSCQGFFVNCQSSGTIDFNNGQRGGSNGQFFRMAAQDPQRMWLSINNSNLELFNQTLVAFDEFATDQKDWGVDAFKFRGNPAISIGAQQDGETYVIATYESIPQSGKVIPLMTYVETAGTYTFQADSMEGFDNYHVFLEDLSNGALYPLTQGDAYSFAMTSADEYNRFQLWFSPVLVTGVNEANIDFSIYATPDDMIVVETTSAENMNGTVQITDMAGRMVLTNDISIANGVGRVQTAGFANGIYAITFVTTDGNRTASQKVALGQ